MSEGEFLTLYGVLFALGLLGCLFGKWSGWIRFLANVVGLPLIIWGYSNLFLFKGGTPAQFERYQRFIAGSAFDGWAFFFPLIFVIVGGALNLLGAVGQKTSGEGDKKKTEWDASGSGFSFGGLALLLVSLSLLLLISCSKEYVEEFRKSVKEGAKQREEQRKKDDSEKKDDSGAKSNLPKTDVAGLRLDTETGEVVFPEGKVWAVRALEGKGWRGEGTTRLKAVEVEGDREKIPADAGTEVMIYTLSKSGGSPATKEEKVKYRDLPKK